MSSPPPPPYSGDTTPTPSSLARIIRTTLSYDTNLMLAAIISLLLVILFILLLHLYTRWFLNHARTRSHTSATVPHVLQTRLHHRFTIIDTSDHSSTKLGLPFEIISSLPLFVYKLHNDDGNDNKLNDRALECAICLSLFEENEIGRKLPGCNHAFHVECIDMWLHSHSTCPICRSSIEHISINKKVEFGDLEQNVNELEIIHSDDQDSQSRLLEIVTVNPDQIDQVDDISDMMDVCPSGSSKKLPSGNSSIGGKINPVSDMHEDESEA